jgi:hypothetical protein
MSKLLTPKISNISNENDVYRFTLSNLNVSLANAIRRTILTEIPTVCFITELESTNTCTIIENSSRLHNEIIKQRLSCIPVFEKTMERLPGKFILEINVKNDTDNTIFVTTEHFKIPVSTTHTITGSIIGVGVTKRVSAVRWGVTVSLLWAWVLTIPVSAVLAAFTYYVINLFI